MVRLPDFQHAAQQLCDYGKILYQRGWSPATSSNYSRRLDAHSCAITSSGKHKGELTPADILVVDLNGQALTAGKPSAETLLHTQLYARDSNIGAVLHTHSALSAVLSQIWPHPRLEIQGWELQKAFAGINSHEDTLNLAIFANSQDIVQLAQQVEQDMQQHGQGQAYLLRGHGVYTWGQDLAACLHQLEALEQLFGYQLELLKLGQCRGMHEHFKNI